MSSPPKNLLLRPPCMLHLRSWHSWKKDGVTFFFSPTLDSNLIQSIRLLSMSMQTCRDVCRCGPNGSNQTELLGTNIEAQHSYCYNPAAVQDSEFKKINDHLKVWKMGQLFTSFFWGYLEQDDLNLNHPLGLFFWPRNRWSFFYFIFGMFRWMSFGFKYMKVHPVAMGGMDRQKFCNCRVTLSRVPGCCRKSHIGWPWFFYWVEIILGHGVRIDFCGVAWVLIYFMTMSQCFFFLGGGWLYLQLQF